MPNGYSETMQILTEILKTSFSSLFQQGFLSVKLADDLFSEDAAKALYMQYNDTTVNLLESLGFAMHVGKSILEPIQQI